MGISSGKLANNYGKSPCYYWINHDKSTISTGPFSTAQTVNGCQRVYIMNCFYGEQLYGIKEIV